MTTTILLADDHVLFRDGLESLLRSRPGFDVIASASDGLSAIKLSLENNPDVCIVDIGMPLLNGIETCRQIKKANRHTDVLMVSMHNDAHFVVDSIRAGAGGYVLKDSASKELFSALNHLQEGKTFISSGIDKNVLDMLLKQKTKSRHVLSHRESEILQLIAEGFSSKDISEHLLISIRTVENHRANIYRKTGLSTIAELIRYAIRNGISPMDSFK
jgi:two-component system, NarL family, response regulator NreC